MQLPSTSHALWSSLYALRPAEELVQLVYAQLEKDFGRLGLAVPFTAEALPESWSAALAGQLAQIDAITLQQLFYMVDLPETLTAQIREAANYHEQLAEVIIYREMVKVYYKLNYSS